MGSFLQQMGLFFGLREREGIEDDTPSSPPVKNAERERASLSSPSKWRDSHLEAHVSTLLVSVAPQLYGMVSVGWNSRMRTTAGIAITSRREIWLNPALQEISDAEVEKTLLHELAHLVAQHRHGRRRIAPHGFEWRQACIDLGIPDEKRTHQLPFAGRRMKRRYRLRCPGCGEAHERVRRPRGRIACLACCRNHNGGHYDERFRFLMTELEVSH